MEPSLPSWALTSSPLLDVGPKLQIRPLALCSCSSCCLSPDPQPAEPQEEDCGARVPKFKSSPAECCGAILTLSEPQFPAQYNKDGMRLFYWVPRASCEIISMKLFVTMPEYVTYSSHL